MWGCYLLGVGPPAPVSGLTATLYHRALVRDTYDRPIGRAHAGERADLDAWFQARIERRVRSSTR
jgi:hypothetical protein